MKHRQAIMVLVALITLQGCSNTRYFAPKSYDDYEQSKLQKDCRNDNSEICLSRAFARQRALDYHKESIGISKETTWVFDTPLIAIASGTAGALLYGANINVIKGLGLAGGTWFGSKGFYYNKATGQYFLRAEEAARCIAKESTVFIGADVSGIQEPVKHLREELPKARTIITDPLLDKTSDEYIALEAAITVADNAVVMGDTATTSIKTASGDIIDRIYSIDAKIQTFIESNSMDVTETLKLIKSSINASVEQAKQQENMKNGLETVDSFLPQSAATRAVAGAPTAASVKAAAADSARKLQTYSTALTGTTKKYVEAPLKMDTCMAGL